MGSEKESLCAKNKFNVERSVRRQYALEVNVAIPWDLRSRYFLYFEWIRPSSHQLQRHVHRQQPMERWIPSRHHHHQYGNNSDFKLAVAVGVRQRANDLTALERQRRPKRRECDSEQLEL